MIIGIVIIFVMIIACMYDNKQEDKRHLEIRKLIHEKDQHMIQLLAEELDRTRK